MDILKPAYNLAPVAGSPLGYKHTDEAKENMRKAQLGNKHSTETKAKMSEARKGNQNAAGQKHTQERIAARLIKIKGVPKSAEHKAKIAAGNRGKFVSEETRRRQSEAAKNRKPRIQISLDAI